MKALILLVLLGGTLTSSAQSKVTTEERQSANKFFTASDWTNAAKAYQSIADQEPQNAGARMRLGLALSGLGKNSEAIKYLEESQKLASNPQTMYFIASVYAKIKNPDIAFEWLDKALTAGFGERTTFQNDANFAEYQKTPRYQEMMNRFDKAVNPCRYSAESRQFDFWIGEWEVKNTGGQSAGTSSIQLLLGDCVLYESWISATPNEYSGKSINFYNSTTRKWQQTWVDDKGGQLEFIDGIYHDNKMVFLTSADTQNQITRLSFHNLDPNKVRQHFEVTKNGGQTWTTTIDLFYYRLNK